MRSLVSAIKDIFRNFFMSLASILSAGATLTILGMALLLVVNLNQLSTQMLQKIDMGTVQMFAEVSDTRVKAIEKELTQMDNVKSVVFIPKEEILKRYIESLGEDVDKDLFKGMDNKMPNVFEIRVSNLEKIDQVKAELDKYPEFDKIRFEQDLTNRMINLSKVVRNVATVLIIALLVITMLIVNNTIRAGIASRSQEISIMRYVGATRGYIRRPYIIEGVLLGLLGALISGVVLYFGYREVLGFIQSQMDFSEEAKMAQDMQVLLNIGILNIVIGVGIGVLGSILSLRRYLKL